MDGAQNDEPAGPWGVRPEGKVSVSPAALILLAAWVGFGAAMGLTDEAHGLITFGFVITGWLLSVIVHEFGHAYVAWRAGDYTVADKGYLTLDPFRYADLFTSILLPLAVVAIGGIGFPGGAVYLRQDLMRSRAWRSAASLAGPAGTFAAFVVLVTGYGLLKQFDPTSPLAPAVALLAFLQATALILNLLPVPGLDGFGVIRPFLPSGVAAALRPVEGFAVMAFLAVLLFVDGPSRWLIAGARDLTHAFGVSPIAALDGLRAFQFWK